MTNVYGAPEKAGIRRRLFDIGVRTLKENGWKVERVQGVGKSSVRRITKGKVSKMVSIRTTQDTWIAFPRDKKDKQWVTLSDVDAVIAVSVDDPDEPRFAQVHFLDGDEMRDRFDRSYKARMAARHSIPLGRGVWVSLYHQEANEPPNRVGAGAGLVHPPIARVPLSGSDDADDKHPEVPLLGSDAPLSIAEAKRRLALTFGVDPEKVKILIEA